MAEVNLNKSEIPTTQKDHKTKEKNEKKLPLYSAKDDSIESSVKSISKNTPDLQPIRKAIRLGSDRNLLLPLLRVDSLPSGDSNQMQHLPTTHKEPESPTYIVEASDSFLDPALYKRYSICTDVDDTFQERIAKKMETIKDVTRDRAVNSITAGENAVYLLVNSFKYLTSGWLGLVILLVTILIYGSIGAFIFMKLESPNEEYYDMNIANIREELADKLEMFVKNETIFKTNVSFLALIQDDLIVYENMYLEYIKHVHNNNVTENIWNFWNSFVFAGTIFTTIGYGHIYPKTTSGRAATIVYAIIGIPLFLIVLTSFGKFLTRIIKFFWVHIFRSVKRLYFRKTSMQKMKNTDAVNRPSLIENKSKQNNPEHIENNNETNDMLESSAIEIDEEFNLPVTLALFILIVYMVFGAIAAHFIESWTFFEAFYCVFISMSTIGLGDLVISDSKNMIYSILYIIFGLSLTAMCIDVVQRKLTVMFKQACEKFLLLVDETDSELESSVSQL